MGAPLIVHRYGRPAGPAVVLLHGLTEAGTAWPDLVERWGDTWRIVAPDLRGHGSSPRFAAGELDQAPELMLADVLAVVDSEADPVVLVGHSLGGLLALRAALARPDRVRALVLEDPARPGPTRVNPPAWIAHNEEFLDSMADQAGEIARMRRESRWSDAEIEAWAACKPQVDRSYIHHGVYAAPADWLGMFEAVAVPTLLLAPTDSDMAPREGTVANPLVRVVTVRDAGHCVRRDQPAVFHAAVDAFLAEALRPVDGPGKPGRTTGA